MSLRSVVRTQHEGLSLLRSQRLGEIEKKCCGEDVSRPECQNNATSLVRRSLTQFLKIFTFY